jgi:glycoside/pentoside/hexuronide:cation symporter, GPH family
VGFLFAMLVWPMAAPLTKKIGKRWGLVGCYGMGLISAAITPFINRPGYIYIIFAIGLVFNFVGQVRGMFLNSLMPDICDVDELESGERREGLYSAVLQFINKIESSLVGLLAMYVLAWTGFDSKMASQNVMPGDDVLIRMLWYGFIPMLIFAVVAFIITFYLPLTPEAMAKVRAELEGRRAAAKQAATEKA